MNKTRIIYNTVLLAILAILIAMPFVHVPITVSSRGTVRPSSEDNKILSMVSGRIVYSNVLKNNQSVIKGDTLLTVTSDILQNKIRHQGVLNSDYQHQLRDLRHLLGNRPEEVTTALYQMEWSSLKQRLAEIETQLTLAKRELERSENLFQQGIVSLADYEKSLYTHQQYDSQLKSAKEQQYAIWQGKRRELEQQLAVVQSDKIAVDIESSNYIIQASADGRVTNLQGFTVGNYIVQGQHIADISAEENLIAECLVPASSIGFIQSAQKVKFQIDTYNYNQWGMLSGTVEDIDHNMVLNEQTGDAFFRVRCRLDDDRLSLKNGYQVAVTKGATYSARFYLTDRTLWQLLFDRVDDWFNPALAKN